VTRKPVAKKARDRETIKINRALCGQIQSALAAEACVLLVGSHEVGKSDLARAVASSSGGQSRVVDCSDPADQADLGSEDGLIRNGAGALLVIDNIEAFPACLDMVRRELDQEREHGKDIGRFLVIVSAGYEGAARQKLGTRGRFMEVAPIDLADLPLGVPLGEANVPALSDLGDEAAIIRPNASIAMETLWLRGGYPQSLLAQHDKASFEWRRRYVDSVCARHAAALGHPVSASMLRSFLERVAAGQGAEFSTNQSLPADQRPLIGHCVDWKLIRQLRPWFVNEVKRFEKHSKLYIRDSGLLHCLLTKRSLRDIRRSAVAYGGSWEGFCVENLITAAGPDVGSYFYRSDDGAEIDLVLEFAMDGRWAIELKGGSGSARKGFHTGAVEIAATRKFVVRPISERVMIGETEALPLQLAIEAVRAG